VNMEREEKKKEKNKEEGFFTINLEMGRDMESEMEKNKKRW
jgi:hypothetical protein